MAGMMPFEDKQIEELFNYFATAKNGKLYCCLMSLLLNTGARISEVLTIRRRDLINKNGEIVDVIKIIKLKTRGKKKIRTLPLQDIFKKYILDYLELQQMRGYEMPYDLVFAINLKQLDRLDAYKELKKAYKFLGFKKKHGTHAFRKTFVNKLYYFYRDVYPNDPLKVLQAIKQIVGHETIETTIKYLPEETTPEDAINNIFNNLEV